MFDELDRAAGAGGVERFAGTPNASGVKRLAQPDGSIAARIRMAAWGAAAIAFVGWASLAIDLAQTLARGAERGWSVALTLFLFFRFFTILANIALAALMSATAVALWRRRPMPSPSLHRDVLVYMVVTGVTYELLLRGLWSPQGIQFCTDLAFHDILPAADLAFWIAAAPKRGLRWGDLPRLVVFPVVYFAVTLVSGALGYGYPYDFFDAGRLGYPAVIAVGMVFLAVFLALGALVTITGRTLTGDRSAKVWRRSSSCRS